MSHRLESNEDTKYQDYKEPKTSRRVSAENMPADTRTQGDVQTQDAESIWNLARESDSPANRGSYSDGGRSVGNVAKKNSE